MHFHSSSNKCFLWLEQVNIKIRPREIPLWTLWWIQDRMTILPCFGVERAMELGVTRLGWNTGSVTSCICQPCQFFTPPWVSASLSSHRKKPQVMSSFLAYLLCEKITFRISNSEILSDHNFLFFCPPYSPLSLSQKGSMVYCIASQEFQQQGNFSFSFMFS